MVRLQAAALARRAASFARSAGPGRSVVHHGGRPDWPARGAGRAPAAVEPLEGRLLFARALGIDVSNYQTVSDWDAVYAAGKRFAFVKATEGGTYTNPQFAAQMNGASDGGVLAGAYHFARPNSNTAATEASKFLSVAGDYAKAGWLRPVLDIETSSLSKAATSAWVNDWCNRVASATGVRPLVYTYVSFAADKLDSTVTQWSPWIASYNGRDPLTSAPSGTAPWTSWSFWQYSQTGRVAGITSGDVDLNAYYYDENTLVRNHVTKGTKFAVGQQVRVNAPSGLKAWNTYASNGTYVVKPNGTTATVKGGPVFVDGYRRWQLQYAGESVTRWSAEDFLAPATTAAATTKSLAYAPATTTSSASLKTSALPYAPPSASIFSDSPVGTEVGGATADPLATL